MTPILKGKHLLPCSAAWCKRWQVHPERWMLSWSFFRKAYTPLCFPTITLALSVPKDIQLFIGMLRSVSSFDNNLYIFSPVAESCNMGTLRRCCRTPDSPTDSKKVGHFLITIRKSFKQIINQLCI